MIYEEIDELVLAVRQVGTDALTKKLNIDKKELEKARGLIIEAKRVLDLALVQGGEDE